MGAPQEVNPGRQVAGRADFDRAYEYAVKSSTHLWIAAVSYRISDASLDFDGVSDDLLILDSENLTGPPGIGCYVCEQVYAPHLRRRKCPGEPSL